MIKFSTWLENISQLWTIRSWSRHSGGNSYEGIYHTEAEAFMAAAKLKMEMEGTGIYFQAVPAPEKYLDQLIKYGAAGSGV